VAKDLYDTDDIGNCLQGQLLIMRWCASGQPPRPNARSVEGADIISDLS